MTTLNLGGTILVGNNMVADHNIETLRDVIGAVHNAVKAGSYNSDCSGWSFKTKVAISRPGIGLQSEWVLVEWLTVTLGDGYDPKKIAADFWSVQEKAEKSAGLNERFVATLAVI